MSLIDRLELTPDDRSAVALAGDLDGAYRELGDQLRAHGSLGPAWSVAGVGLWFGADNRTQAAMFINLHGYAGPTLSLEQFSAPFAVSVTRSLMSHHLPLDRVQLVGVSPATHHRGPGGAVQATYGGTLGTRATSNRCRCILTAGHVVAEHLDRLVSDGDATVIGRVIFRDCPSLHDPCQDSLDLGVIEVADGYDVSGGPIYKPPPQRLSKRLDVKAYSRLSKSREGWIEAICRSWVGKDSSHGDWAEIIRIRPRVSVHGDSGALVVLRDSDELLGHIVGGGSDYSLVQDAEYQLDAARLELA